MKEPEIYLLSIPYVLGLWIVLLIIGLYLGLFRAVVDRIRAGVASLPETSLKSVNLLQRMLQAPNHARPLHVESALFSFLQCGFGSLCLFLLLPQRSFGFLLVAFALAFLVERLFSGVFPRLLASSKVFELHLRIGFPLTLFARFLSWPFSSLLIRIESGLCDSVNQGDISEEEDNEVADHIRTLAREGSNLDPNVAEIVGNTLEMGQLEVRDIMISRKQVQILDDGDSLEKNLEIARSCGHTRLPLCEGDLDHCLGKLHQSIDCQGFGSSARFDQ